MIFSTLTRRTSIRRFSEKWLRKAELLATVRRQKIARHGRRCQILSPVCTRWEGGLHHLKKRSQGGADTDANTMLSCCACNRFIERNPAWALEHGFTQRRSP